MFCTVQDGDAILLSNNIIVPIAEDVNYSLELLKDLILGVYHRLDDDGPKPSTFNADSFDIEKGGYSPLDVAFRQLWRRLFHINHRQSLDFIGQLE